MSLGNGNVATFVRVAGGMFTIYKLQIPAVGSWVIPYHLPKHWITLHIRWEVREVRVYDSLREVRVYDSLPSCTPSKHVTAAYDITLELLALLHEYCSQADKFDGAGWTLVTESVRGRNLSTAQTDPAFTAAIGPSRK
jgi:hypothetical protein